MDQKLTIASEETSDVQLSYLSNGTWKTFNDQVQSSMDGIKIQTSSNSSYYLQYRTWNQGRTDYYPYVKSNVNDYAGSSGKPIQQLQIQAYNNDGTKLTTGIVVMYRACVDGEWLPWVSNADPDWMRNVQNEYNLDGTLDTNASYAGESGKNISGIEIRVYEEEGAIGDFSGGEATASLSYMVDSTSDWNSFERSTVADHIDGIKIQTSTNKSYYLLYKTWNSGQTSYYPAIKSTDNDYAGSAGKAIQRLNIQAYKNDGTKLTSEVIVMYRAYVNGEWLPWVSNADPEWMRSVQSKYSLGSTLDTSGSFAGMSDKDLSGVEIRIFEDDSMNAGTDDFSGDELNLSLSYMADSDDNWNDFSKSITASHIDGIRIQTDSSLPFYLLYKTLNAGRGTYYPEVLSAGNDYAGTAGEPIQQLSIHAYNTDGTKLTSGVVVMYRALVEGSWLPWVSNADPEWMQSVQIQYNLGGTLDLDASFAGVSGKNISGIEIRTFVGDTDSTPIENLPGTEAAPSLSYMFNSTSNWHSFDKSVMAEHIDGIKIQTDPNKEYYIKYQTWNSGQSSYYPEVNSTGNDYAGSAGKPIQRLGLHVYRNDGVKLTTGVVVMFRAYVDGSWLSWVSNADPEWMRSVQSKYNLGGILDTGSYYAGIAGKNISGIEIRVFEENSINIAPTAPTGNYKIIQAPFISQLGKYPTGCESVTTVMALNYAGIDISVDEFIDTYLDMSGIPFDPNVTFGGNPRSSNSYGCYAPVIKKASDSALSGKNYTANVLSDISLEVLCSQYIDKDIPVIMWATMYMNPPYISSTWTFNGKTIQWVAPEHCLLLVGYDDNNYIFNDPLQTQALKYYSKSSVEVAYEGLFSQAIVIVEKEPADPLSPPAYQYGAVENPVTKEIYPIKVYENGKQYYELPFEEEINEAEMKPTYLQKLNFNVGKFISGLEFDDTISKTESHPPIGNLMAIIMGGITSFADSWESLYIDIDYYKDPTTGQKKAVVRCGESKYSELFDNWTFYGIRVSLKSLHSIWSGTDAWDAAIWEKAVDDMAKEQYGRYKGVTPDDGYQYDLEYTIDKQRKGDKYVSYIFLGDGGKMYEYAKMYDSEKIEIVVTQGLSHEEVDRINILPLLSPVSQCPEDKAALFDIMIPRP
ncbi:C39 family peptidase [Caproicibacter fermentans]|uniref:C39 family peptidase n=1 Tax=Caproicibacter fermentans TaxID=2576756 RepID=A0A7G8TF16_9FIRM|nr:C39 family peptidase [Caproicibacter fermentans]QNK42207.1 C39 family peptidase [Caproicibacter fermentans]